MKKENQPYHEEDLGLWGTPAATSRLLRWWEGKTKSAGGILPEKDGKEKWETQKNQYKRANRNPSSEGFNDMVETNIIINKTLFPQARQLGVDEIEYKKQMLSLFLETLNQIDIRFLPSQKQQKNVIHEMKQTFETGLTVLFQKP